MRLSWNEIRARASSFAREWCDAAYEKGETQSFYNDFFNIFGVQRRSVARYEEHVTKLNDRSGYIDLFWPGVLIVEQKSAGGNFTLAERQAGEYFDAIQERDRPRFILLSDFKTFELHDLDERTVVRFALSDLPQYVESFGFILGVQLRTFRDQDPANVEAAELVGRLYDTLVNTGHSREDLNRFLVRLVFCMFADDTGVFEPRDIFLDFLETRTREDGTDLGPWLEHLFEVLDTNDTERPLNLDEDLARFPYINGDLFKGRLRTFSFDALMREALLDACRFDWSKLSPAIFGALFQSVMEPTERRAQGAHYTTERNILKVIEPLFLEEFQSEFERIRSRRGRNRRNALRRFQRKLGTLKFLDPACGCGNFLIVAYRELRLLEIRVLREIENSSSESTDSLLDAAWHSMIDVDQFYGIELNEFPSRIAETALWMMDHIMNNRLSLEFGRTYARIPLTKSPHIIQADALEIDWSNVLSPNECSFVFGNPPFIGARFQSPKQRAQVRKIALSKKGSGTLDYVTAWFLKAGAYVSGGNARIGFVATNSITQGDQVGNLWPTLFEHCKLEIAFAHRTFMWGSDARGKAHVHVVILGLDQSHSVRAKKLLFSYPDIRSSDSVVSTHTSLSPYLIDFSRLNNPHLVVREESAPINGMPRLETGVQMIDNGILTFTQSEYEDFIRREPGAKRFFRKYVGGDEYINGFHRWILYLTDSSPAELRSLPKVTERIRRVREYRAASRRASTVALAEYPTRIGVDHRITQPFLVLPNTSSERRDYIPIGWLTPDVIANQKLRILPKATTVHFAILTSAMHMSWMRAVTGRLESRYMYSVGVVYNTFPTPPKSASLSRLSPLAQDVLDARDAYPDATLADLYDPDLMPPELRKAHTSLDIAVDSLYRRSGFKTEHERIEHLFSLYERRNAPIEYQLKKDATRPKRTRKR